MNERLLGVCILKTNEQGVVSRWGQSCCIFRLDSLWGLAASISLYIMHLFSQHLPKPSVPLWFCLCALKQRSHLTSSPTHVLMTHQCNFINCYDSGRKSHPLEIIADFMHTQEMWADSIKKQYHRKNRAVSRKWAKRRVLDKSHFCYTPWHVHTLIA